MGDETGRHCSRLCRRHHRLNGLDPMVGTVPERGPAARRSRPSLAGRAGRPRAILRRRRSRLPVTHAGRRGVWDAAEPKQQIVAKSGEVERAEAELGEIGGLRVVLQKQARSQLAEEGKPVTLSWLSLVVSPIVNVAGGDRRSGGTPRALSEARHPAHCREVAPSAWTPRTTGSQRALGRSLNARGMPLNRLAAVAPPCTGALAARSGLQRGRCQAPTRRSCSRYR